MLCPDKLGLTSVIRYLSLKSDFAISGASDVVQMVEDVYRAAETFGDSLLLLDGYFLSVPAFQKFQELTGKGTVRIEIATKAKRNCTA